MKRGSAAALLAALTTTGLLAGCGDREETKAATPAAEVVAPATTPAPATPAETVGPAAPAAAGAPAFAVIYPGGAADGAPVLAQSPSGPGGMLTFTTDADPETVVAFYKDRAEASGLKSITAMNQGEARGYSAGDGANGRGQLLSVVANPVEGGSTSVQLSWSAGR
jgi:hypothetical protein